MAKRIEGRLRWFRIAFVVIVGWPWVVRAGLMISGESSFNFFAVIGLTIAIGLIAAGVGNPSGIAPFLVVLFLCLEGVGALANPDVPDWWAAVIFGEALVIAVLLLPMWARLRSAWDHSELERVDARGAALDRRTSARRTERALRRSARS